MASIVLRFIKCVLTLSTMYIITSDVRCAAEQPDVICGLVTVIEPSDPVDNNLLPHFAKRQRCRGGINEQPKYQCQPSKYKTETEEYMVMHTGKTHYKQVQVPTECSEVCVCNHSCKNKWQKDGKCDSGFTWDPSSCKCECIAKTPTNGQYIGGNGGKKTSGVSMKFHIITIFCICLLFMVAIIVGMACHRRRQSGRIYRQLPGSGNNQPKKEFRAKYKKYRQWADEMNDPLIDVEKDQVDAGEQASVGCSSADRDALTAEDCVNIGYIAFKRDNYHSMLHWLQLAKKKRDSDLEGNEGSFNDEELTKYLSVAHVMAGKKGDADRCTERAQNQRTNGVVTGIRLDAVEDRNKHGEEV